MDKLKIYEKMITIRLFEEKVSELFSKNLIRGSIHLYIGEEAVAVGTCSNLNLEKGDGITSTHRGHGHFIAMGGDVKYMMAELLGKKNGYCKGRGGSMHIADKNLGVYGANGIVGGGIAIAGGLALASSLMKKDGVAITFFGDGASNQGVLYEVFNISSILNLPVIFVCENNMYAQTTPFTYSFAGKSVAKRAEVFNIEGIEIDGNDIEKVYETAKYAIEKARNKKGPTLIEAKTYRLKGHWQGDPEVYRTKSEVKEWEQNCPIKRYESKLINNYKIDINILNNIKNEVKEKINDAEKFAIASEQPDMKSLYEDLYI